MESHDYADCSCANVDDLMKERRIYRFQVSFKERLWSMYDLYITVPRNCSEGVPSKGGGGGTFRDGTHHEKYQRGGWVKMANIEKYFGTFRSQFHEKLTKIVKN